MMVTMTAKKASEYASQPIRGDHFFTHSAPGRVGKTSIDINHGREQRHQSSLHPIDAAVAVIIL